MNVIFCATYGMNIDIQISTNARDVRPQLGSKLSIDDFPSVLCAKHHVDDILRVGVRHVPHLRCSAPYIPRAQRLRAGLNYVAPPALMRNLLDSLWLHQGQGREARNCRSQNTRDFEGAVRVAPIRPAGQTRHRLIGTEESHFRTRLLLARPPLSLREGPPSKELEVLARQARTEPGKG